jgi:hypothetical protein
MDHVVKGLALHLSESVAGKGLGCGVCVGAALSVIHQENRHARIAQDSIQSARRFLKGRFGLEPTYNFGFKPHGSMVALIHGPPKFQLRHDLPCEHL